MRDSKLVYVWNIFLSIIKNKTCVYTIKYGCFSLNENFYALNIYSLLMFALNAYFVYYGFAQILKLFNFYK